MTGPCTSMLCVKRQSATHPHKPISARQTESAWIQVWPGAFVCKKGSITDGIPERRKVYGKFVLQLPIEASRVYYGGILERIFLSAVPNPALARPQHSGTDGQQNDRHQAQHGQRQCDIG